MGLKVVLSEAQLWGAKVSTKGLLQAQGIDRDVVLSLKTQLLMIPCQRFTFTFGLLIPGIKYSSTTWDEVLAQ